MNSTSVISDVITNLIRQGKNKLHDKYVTKIKMPPFVNTQIQQIHQQIVIQGGNQQVQRKKNNYFKLQNEEPPKAIEKDQYSSRTLSVTHQVRYDQSLEIKDIQKKNNQYASGHKKTNKQTKSGSIIDKTSKKQKQNSFILLTSKITEENKQTNGEQKEELSLRQTKRQSLLKQYEEKCCKLNTIKDNEARKNKLQIFLKSHTSKGENYKFTFDIEGELLLFHEDTDQNINRKYPPATHFQIKHDQADRKWQTIDGNYKTYEQLGENNKHMHSTLDYSSSNQRIKSAKREAFASKVMKTVNLSRVLPSDHVDDDQFMKRNDLFNNNHSRQTTNIPYFKPKNGTFYSEIATKQMTSIDPKEVQTYRKNQQSTHHQSQAYSKRKTYFQAFHSKSLKYGIHSRKAMTSNCEQRDIFTQRKGDRSIKTAGIRPKTCLQSERRPIVSARTGRITTANENLKIDLLE